MRNGLLSGLALFALVAACGKSGESPAPSATLPPRSSAAPSAAGAASAAGGPRDGDIIATAQGDLRIVPLHHATLMFAFAGKYFFVDPSKDVTYDDLPKADVVFITDIHQDHLDPDGLAKVKKADTVVVAPPAVADKLKGLTTGPVAGVAVTVMKNGDARTVAGVGVEAVPMYNRKRGPAAGQLYHDKGRGDGFVLTFGDKRIYLSGDTECVDEMKGLKNIDVAFVCMNLPYTMPPSEAAECVKAFKPKILYPYHFRNSNLDELLTALKDEPKVEVRIRRWY
jgi:L-ascorbate metabolism protein UlaG (beta-lactamase superfamily)